MTMTTATFPIYSKMVHSKKMILDVIKTCDGIDTLDLSLKVSQRISSSL